MFEVCDGCCKFCYHAGEGLSSDARHISGKIIGAHVLFCVLHASPEFVRVAWAQRGVSAEAMNREVLKTRKIQQQLQEKLQVIILVYAEFQHS